MKNFLQKIKNLYHLLQSFVFNLIYFFPSRKLTIIGVTGTDGKTTTTSLIYHILKNCNVKVGYISTIEARIGEKIIDTGLHVTTPDPWQVPKLLNMMIKEGITHVVIESTSSGLHQNRLFGIKFDSATITNIKSDHLDYHGNWENYANAKFILVKKLKQDGLLVLNEDDSSSEVWLKKKLLTTRFLESSRKVIWYKKSNVKEFMQDLNGMRFNYQNQIFEFPLIGDYNLENLLASIEITKKYVNPKQIAKAIKTFSVPKGRMESVFENPKIIIDFAHTAHALDQALKALTPLISKNAKLIVVFGCAGLRDPSRRQMGSVASKYANIIVLTAEDPRTEMLYDINSEIISYAQKAGSKLVKRYKDSNSYQKDLTQNINQYQKNDFSKKHPQVFAFDEQNTQSRTDAIDFAIKIANNNDIVFITGKAHEQSLAFSETEYPWSDHDTVEQILKNLKLVKSD